MRELKPQFDTNGKFHNENVFGALCEIRIPDLPTSAGELDVQYTPAKGDEDAWDAAQCEVTKLDAIVAVLMNAGFYDETPSIEKEISVIRAALDGRPLSTGI